jgi:3-methyladenine DNA glycosylase/8-oxoguanine DNA glycosylase
MGIKEGEKDMENIIGLLLAFAGSFVPIMGLVWKMSAVVSRVKQNTADIGHVAEKVRKLDVETGRKFEEITAKLSNIDVKLASIEKTLEFLREEKK